MSGSPLDATGVLHIVDQLMGAGSHAERAGILLRVPDAILTGYGGQFIEACTAKGFASADGFVSARISALTAVRDEHGLLPYAIAEEVERWRVSFSKIASGQ